MKPNPQTTPPAQAAPSPQEMLAMLISLGRIFSHGKNFTEIFGELMNLVCGFTGADGGSLYIYDPAGGNLKIVVMKNTTLKVQHVVEDFDALRIKGLIEVPTRDASGALLIRNASVCSFLKNQKVLVPSLEADDKFDFANTRKFDEQNNYQTRNLMALPLMGHNGRVVGVMQLINCNDTVFSDDLGDFIDAIAGQVGIMLSNAMLVNESQSLMSAVIEMIGVAIDEKSPHTAGHCQRVTALTMMIAEEMEAEESHALYKDFSLSAEERRELQISALLHDVGKIITPTHILDKPTRLYMMHDKMGLLDERLRAWDLSQQLRDLKARLKEEGMEHLLAPREGENAQIQEEYAFLDKVNKGNLFVDDEAQKRLQEIADRRIDYTDGKTTQAVIDDEDLKNLKIPRGTLNPEERQIMEDHVSISIRLLSSIPWPANLGKVVEYAGAHHENMNGTGYPNKITGDAMALPARILGIADRFEGLSAPDRPYRSTKMTLSRVMFILEDMAAKEEIDREIFEFFKEKKLHLKYAEKYLPKELIDC